MSNTAVKPGYKLTELGVIPEDWSLTTLGDVVDKIVGGGTPSRSNSAYWGNEIPWVTVKDFATFNSQSAQEYISSLGLQNSSSNLIPQGTLITSTRMALGKAIIYDVDVAINQDLKAIFPKRLLDTKFLYFWFQQNSEFLEALGSGSTVMGLSLIDLKNTKFLLPPLPEQKAIAAALSDVDALIAAQEALIAKKRDIKTATMQQLLTGKVRLGAFGQRAGASEGKPEAGVPPGYQQTELGVIPADWEVKKLGEVSVVKTGPFGSALHESDYVQNGTPIITVEHLGERGVVYKNLPLVSDADKNRLSAYLLKENDIVFSRVGSIDRNALIRRAESGWLFSGRLLRVRINNQSIYPAFISHQFHSEPFKKGAALLGQT